MYSHLCAVLLISLAISHSTGAIHGVNPKVEAAFGKPTFTCLDGSKTISSAEVNDDYCDCTDGSDEPGTPACSENSFYCVNSGHVPSTVASSRVLDGICDCCDGSDELNLKTQTTTCANTCREAAREARKGLRAQIAKYETGLKAKEAFLETFLAKIEEEKLRKFTLELEKKTLVEKETAQSALKDALQAKRDAKAESLKAEITVLVEQEIAARPPPPPPEPTPPQDPPADGSEPVPPPPPPPPPTPEELEKEKQNLITEKTNANPEVAAIQEELQRADEDLILVRDERTGKDNTIKEIETFLNTDFGTDYKWAYLHNRVISSRNGEYTYELHAFKEVKQVGGGTHNLGRWKQWDGSVMVYEGGDRCWGGPERSMRATIVCGGEDKVNDVKEPAKCEYYMTVETPAGCTREDYDKLKAQLAHD